MNLKRTLLEIGTYSLSNDSQFSFTGLDKQKYSSRIYSQFLCFVDKPSLTVDHPLLEQLIEYNSLEVCCKGNSNPPLDEILWMGNVKALVAKDNESCMTSNPIYRTNTGNYACVASNSIGTSHSQIFIEVKCKFS